MTPTPPTPGPAATSLVERRQRLARQRIVEAADALFAERGYGAVSVTDIAARAEVGRTTFFRYFGDKTEVVFAQEQAMLDAVARVADLPDAGTEPATAAARTTGEALEQLRPVVLDLCARAAEDPGAYRRHVELVEQHLELRAREALKAQEVARGLAAVLRGRGTDEAVAVLAAQLALACYQAALLRVRASEDASLTAAVRAAFDEALALGS